MKSNETQLFSFRKMLKTKLKLEEFRREQLIMKEKAEEENRQREEEVCIKLILTIFGRIT